MSINKYPLCILTAGEGTRLLPLTKTINKSLIPINGKPIISHILERVDCERLVVIALGFKGALVRDYLETFFPKHNFLFVEVSNYNGVGSGPGLSLYACQDKLQSPFFWVACDTLWESDLSELPTDYNWIGTSSKYNDNKEIFCNVVTDEMKSVMTFYDKVDPQTDAEAFIGLSFVKDYNVFWRDLKESTSQNLTEIYLGYDSMVKSRDLKTMALEWNDVGNFENIEKFTMNKFNFSKPDEFIWFDHDKVIKLFKNNETLDLKFQRAKMIKNFIPRDVSRTNNYLFYDFCKGDTFYQSYDENSFIKLLETLNSQFWKKTALHPSDFGKSLKEFYIDKSQERISLFKQKYSNWHPEKVNNNKYYSFEDKILNQVKEKMISTSIPGTFHGDFQFDNIVYDGESFTLIDWRESFGSQSKWGDIYYDFSKLYGGLILNYSLIKKNEFSFCEEDGEINISYAEEPWQNEAKNVFTNFLNENGYDVRFVKLLTSLIYLNMAPLHHYPFDKFLYSLSFQLFQDLHDEV